MLQLAAAFPPSLWNNIDRKNLSLQSIIVLLGNLIQIALAVAGVLAVIFIIFGGIKYITSTGSPDGTRSAKNTLSNAVIGLVITALAYTIVGFVIGKL